MGEYDILVSMNLELWIDKLKAGENQYMKEIFKSFYGYVMSISLRYTSDYQEAEELTNDVFMKVYNNIHQYDSARSFKNWLSKIAVNTSLDLLRSKKNAISFTEILTDHNAIKSEDEIEIREDQEILPILQSLPPRYKIVFNLYVFEEYSHNEIAELLGISIGTSKSNYHRAKKIIIEKLRSEPNYQYLLNPAI